MIIRYASRSGGPDHRVTVDGARVSCDCPGGTFARQGCWAMQEARRRFVQRTSPMLDHALAYAAAGIPVFPVQPAGKIPLTRHGFMDATTDPAAIRAWWRDRPAANIGAPTGIVFDVVDLDGAEGEASVADVPAWSGPQARTGGGGRHLFVQPTGEVNRAHMLPKVDFRGHGGYVLLPPSLHASGRRYEWLVPLDVGLPAAPDWLLDVLQPQLRLELLAENT